MINEPSPTGEKDLARTRQQPARHSAMVMYDISHGRGTRGISRFEKRLRDKRRRSTPSVEPSRPAEKSSDERAYDRETWQLVGIAFACLILIEVITWWVR